MREGSSPTVHRSDYAAPAFWIRRVDLVLELDPAKTMVINQMRLERNPDVPAQPLKLHGEDLNLTRVLVNGASVSFKHEDGLLVLDGLPDEPFTLEVRNTCAPEKNTHLSGLYTSGGGLFTQCEAEGFRRITYFLDRPDVMAVYRVTLRANKAAYPVLLCNGNLVESGNAEQGRHYAVWSDPHPKPSYLFALVAADLVAREQHVRTRAGKDHLLQIYVRRGDLDKTEHAMNSLIASIVWDEARFNLSLDLERYMVVAVGDFNMGAMENKGLNIFNTKFVLASPTTATDRDYANIESVIGHEYFHNWTGNRITCRDWFQLSLKEGLTVFRDQEFSMDMAGHASSRAVKRIEDVRGLREVQFPEDAGPMAHPVRPDSYAEINNFYTATVYQKGAEVVRMMHTLVGRAGFAQGMALYFKRHDGQAVTCDDFAQAIADANPNSELAHNLPEFKRWYSQPGTPHVMARGRYDAHSRTYTLGLEQSSATGQPPQVIPIAMGLVSRTGQPLPLQLEGETTASTHDRVLVLKDKRSFHTFINVEVEPVPSLLRGFSAPVSLTDGLQDADLLVLLQHDTDAFNRWEAGQTLSLHRLLEAVRHKTALQLDEPYLAAMRAVLRHPTLDAAFKDLVLLPPSELYLAQQLAEVDPAVIHTVRLDLLSQLARALHADWVWAFETHGAPPGAYSPNPVAAGQRALANRALFMLCLHAVQTGDAVWPGRALQRFKTAADMTTRLGALAALVHSHSPLAQVALEQFHRLFAHEALLIDTWFSVQAGAPETADGQVFTRVQALLKHPDFTLKNPNRARSLIAGLCAGNPAALHRADGAGYIFWADHVLQLDAINPQLAARMARSCERWGKLAPLYRSVAHAQITRVAAHEGLSNDVAEVVGNVLKA
jgi:aminopeptidase N